MMDMADRVQENRVRRVALRRGYRVVKSRRRDPKALDYERYCILDLKTNCVVAGGSPLMFSFTLDDVDAWLAK